MSGDAPKFEDTMPLDETPTSNAPKFEDTMPLDETSPSNISKTESFLRGGSQGATLGFQDELSARFEQGIANTAKWLGLQPEEVSKLYDEKSYEDLRNTYRNQNKTAEEANPKSYLAGQVAGTALATAAPAGIAARGGALGLSAANAAKLAGQGAAGLAGTGAVAGAGNSEADLTQDPGQFALDTAVGAGTNLALGGALAAAPVVAKGAGALASKVAPEATAAVKKGAEAVLQSAPVQATKNAASYVGDKALTWGVKKPASLVGMDVNGIANAFNEGRLNQVDLLTAEGKKFLENRSINASKDVAEVIQNNLGKLRALKEQQLGAKGESGAILGLIDESISEAQNILGKARTEADITAANKYIQTLNNYKKAASAIDRKLVNVGEERPVLTKRPGKMVDSKTAQTEVVRETADLQPQGLASDLSPVGESGTFARPVEPDVPGQTFKDQALPSQDTGPLPVQEVQPVSNETYTPEVQSPDAPKYAPGIVKRTANIEEPLPTAKPDSELQNMAQEGLGPQPMSKTPPPAGDGIYRQADTSTQPVEALKAIPVQKTELQDVVVPKNMSAQDLDFEKRTLQSYAQSLKDNANARAGLSAGTLTPVEDLIAKASDKAAAGITSNIENISGADLHDTNATMSKLLTALNELPKPGDIAAGATDPGLGLTGKQKIAEFLDVLNKIPDDQAEKLVPGLKKQITDIITKAQKGAEVLKTMRGGDKSGYIEQTLGVTSKAAAGLANQAGLAQRNISNRLGALSSTLIRAPEKLGQFAPMLQKAAEKGNASLAATQFILQQKYPEFQKMMQDMDDEHDEWIKKP